MCPKRPIKVVNRPGKQYKTAYKFAVTGNLANQWIMTLYPLMGRRRKEKIRELLLSWKNRERRDNGVDYCLQGHKLDAVNRGTNGQCRICKGIWQKDYMHPREKLIRSMMKRGITREQAEKNIAALETIN